MSVRAKLQAWIARQWQKRGAWTYFTCPLAWIYGLIARHRRQAYLKGTHMPTRVQVPVIVIGNIYVGGTGKTPLACAIADLLKRQGWQPGLVSRGYGREDDDHPAIGHADDLDWQTFGDEPALIAKKTGIPVSVQRNRALAAQALLTHFPETDVIISDDGLQHYGLARDFEILVQDDRGVGNGLLLPAGPLREPASRLKQVDLVLTRRADPSASELPAFGVQITHFWQPATGARLDAAAFAAHFADFEPLVAMAGIGVPQRFFMSLQALGIPLAQVYSLADHAAIDAQWLAQLSAKTILVTEKDAVKLSRSVTDNRLWVAETSVQWWRDDVEAVLTQMLAEAGIRRMEP